MPAMRVCREWGSLLLDEKTQVACEDQGATDWLEGFFARSGFWARAQDTVVKSLERGARIVPFPSSGYEHIGQNSFQLLELRRRKRVPHLNKYLVYRGLHLSSFLRLNVVSV